MNAADVPTLTPDQLRREYISGGARFIDSGFIPVQETPFDRAVAKYGLNRVVNMMNADPKVGGTMNMVKTAVLAEGIDVTPSHLPKFGGETEDQPDDWEPDDAKHAFETGQFVARCFDRLMSPFPMESFVWQLLDGIGLGCKLAEKVWKVDESGIDAGRMVLDRIKIKDQQSWSFVTDDYDNVLGVTPGWSAKTLRKNPADLEIVPRDKVVVFTWDPKNDDPRGNPLYRRVYDPYWAKVKTLLRYDEYEDKFAAPTWVATVGPNQVPRPERDGNGAVKVSNKLPEDDLLAAVIALKGCRALVMAYGATAKAEYPDTNGEAFINSLNYRDKQIVSAITQAPRATEEAAFGSRADSETAQDTAGTLYRYIKQAGSRVLRQDIARDLVRFNWGDDWAERYTPNVSLGKTEHMDFSRNAGAVAKLWAANFLDESQRPGLCTFMGLPLPKPRKAKPNEPKVTDPGKSTNDR